MKKTTIILLSILLGMFTLCMFAGCSRYHVPKDHCIVGLRENYQLYDDAENKLCEPINKPIRGVDKDYNTKYYSVIKGATYTLICNDYIDKRAGFGRGIGYYDFVPAWWQGNVITSLYKYDGNSMDKFYETSFSNVREITAQPKVIFNQNCTVQANIEPYLYVGGIYEIVKKNSSVADSNIGNFLNEFGIINETDGFYFLLLKDEVCVHQDAWKTNLDIIDYQYEKTDSRNSAMKIQFTASAPVVAENEDLFLHIVCRTISGKYFVYPQTYQGAQGFEMPIRQDELKLTFER